MATYGLWVQCVAKALAEHSNAVGIFNILINDAESGVLTALSRIPDTPGKRQIVGQLAVAEDHRNLQLEDIDHAWETETYIVARQVAEDTLNRFIAANPTIDVWAIVSSPDNNKRPQSFLIDFLTYYFLPKLVEAQGLATIERYVGCIENLLSYTSDKDMQLRYVARSLIDTPMDRLYAAMELASQDELNIWLQSYYTELITHRTIPAMGAANEIDRRNSALVRLYAVGLVHGLVIPPPVDNPHWLTALTSLGEPLELYPRLTPEAILALRQVYQHAFTPAYQARLTEWLPKLNINVQPCVDAALAALSGGVSMDPRLLTYLAGFVAPS